MYIHVCITYDVIVHTAWPEYNNIIMYINNYALSVDLLGKRKDGVTEQVPAC